MAKLYVMQGLPGAGKSVVAEQLTARESNTVRVSKDSLRHMFFFIDRPKEASKNRTSLVKEEFVEHLEFVLIHILLSQGSNVVVDDTNLDPRRVALLQAIAELSGNQYEIVTVKKSIDECIRNDRRRNPPAGEEVIRAYAKRWAPYHDWIKCA